MDYLLLLKQIMLYLFLSIQDILKNKIIDENVERILTLFSKKKILIINSFVIYLWILIKMFA
jgi:hypothetical protein